MSRSTPEPAGSGEPALAEVLTDMLKRADAAHLAFEREHGPTEWQQWYAQHLARVTSESPFGYEQILTALRDAAHAHHFYEVEIGGPHADWAPWYAEHMAASLARNWNRVHAELDTLFDVG